MCSELLKKLIIKEFKEKGIEETHNVILYQQDVNEIFEKYNVKEWCECFYDGDPPECNTCKKTYRECTNCPIYKAWWDGENLEQRLSFNNWIDIYGPGIWNQSQNEVNEDAKEFFEKHFINNVENVERTYYYIKNNYLTFILFKRDIKEFSCDYWFVFEKKAGV